MPISEDTVLIARRQPADLIYVDRIGPSRFMLVIEQHPGFPRELGVPAIPFCCVDMDWIQFRKDFMKIEHLDGTNTFIRIRN